MPSHPPQEFIDDWKDFNAAVESHITNELNRAFQRSEVQKQNTLAIESSQSIDKSLEIATMGGSREGLAADKALKRRVDRAIRNMKSALLEFEKLRDELNNT